MLGWLYGYLYIVICGNYTLDQTTPKQSLSASSDDGTASDTSTPKASPEPPELIISTPTEDQTDITPPPPPPRTFTLPRDTMEQLAKLSSDKGNSKPTPDADKYFKSNKVSDPEEPDGGSMTLKRREYNMNMISSQIDYITAVSMVVM